MIDLPGVTRVPVKGSDQKEDIERITREMTLRCAAVWELCLGRFSGIYTRRPL